MSLKSKAIVLAKQNFGEADQYIQFYTQDWGLVTVLAKSARKSKRRYIGGLDLFCHDEIFLRGDPRERPYLLELKVLNSFSGIRDSLDKLFVAGKLLQWVKRLGDTTNPLPEVYSLLGQTLALLEKEPSPERLSLLILVFKLKLLSRVGLKPRLDQCIQCSSPVLGEASYFDIAAGGTLCGACSAKLSRGTARMLNPTEANFLYHVDSLRLTRFENLQLPHPLPEHLNQITTEFASFHTHVFLPN